MLGYFAKMQNTMFALHGLAVQEREPVIPVIIGRTGSEGLAISADLLHAWKDRHDGCLHYDRLTHMTGLDQKSA